MSSETLLSPRLLLTLPSSFIYLFIIFIFLTKQNPLAVMKNIVKFVVKLNFICT